MQTAAGALYLATNVEYKARRIVAISGIETDISSIEYLRLNLNICNKAVFDRAQS